MICQTPHGIAVQSPSRRCRPTRPTREQILRLRHEDWRVMHEVGVVDPDGVRRRRSFGLIARISGVSKTRVKEGIDEARRLNEALSDALSLFDLESIASG